MTAPDRTTWTVAEDADGDETLWYGDTAVLRRCDIPSIRLAGAQSYDVLWDVLTAVLASDEATLMLLEQRIDSYALVLDDPEQRRWCVEDVLAALTDSRHPLAALAGSGESE